MLQRARLAAGETLLVVGAGGGVGSASLAIGQRMGAQVYVTSRDPAKRAHAIELGALDAFPSDEKLPVRADVVVDTVGEPTWAFSIGALAPGGRLVTCGAGGGRVEVNLPRLFFGQHEDHWPHDGRVPRVRRADSARCRRAARPRGQRLPPGRLPFALARMEAGVTAPQCRPPRSSSATSSSSAVLSGR